VDEGRDLVLGDVAPVVDDDVVPVGLV
jgi:hypothetical protein